nr:MAG TPA: hypothetical protein [Caudoviricetes sp.]
MVARLLIKDKGLTTTSLTLVVVCPYMYLYRYI